MISREDICATCTDYVAAVAAHDTDAVMRLFTSGATQEEPVGSTPRVGHAEIRAFFKSSESFPFTVRRIGPITVSGNVAAFQIRVDFPSGDAASMTSTDIVSFDDDGRIRSIVAIPDPDADPDVRG
jgi:steroid delta-isomerase